MKQQSYHDHKKLLKIARELCPNDVSLVEELSEIVETTPEYSSRYEQYTDPDTYGFVAVEVEEHLHEELWNAFLNGLRERSLLADVGLKEMPSGVILNIDDLLEHLPSAANLDWKSRWHWVEAEGWYKELPKVFLKQVQERLFTPTQKILTCLDIEADEDGESYALCLIEADKFDKIKKLSEESAYGKLVKVAEL